jgi:hypothetical protein
VADLVFVAALVAFLALCALYVRGCEWLIGSADQDSSTEASR